jgi:hypothetical protein
MTIRSDERGRLYLRDLAASRNTRRHHQQDSDNERGRAKVTRHDITTPCPYWTTTKP